MALARNDFIESGSSLIQSSHLLQQHRIAAAGFLARCISYQYCILIQRLLIAVQPFEAARVNQMTIGRLKLRMSVS